MLTSRRFSLDTMIYDKLAVEDAVTNALIAAIEHGRLEPIVTTHVQVDQLADAPLRTRAVAERIPHLTAATAGFVLDVSRLDMARLWEAEPIDAIRGNTTPGNLGHAEDALTLNTAVAEDAVLVTAERRLRNRAAALNLCVWSWSEFREHVLALAPA